MAVEVTMPDWGTSVDTVILLKWLKREGEHVRRGEVLCEIETDKAATEMESFAEGVLLRRMVPEGGEVRTGAVIAYVGQPGEQVPQSPPQGPGETAEQAGPPHEQPAGPQPHAEQRVSPMIRNLARREGVDLAAVVATGPGGCVTRADVLRAKGAPGGPPPPNPAAPENSPE